MTITQTVEIPADRRLIIDVPDEVPPGTTILAFTPAASIKKRMSEAEEIELLNKNAERLRQETLDVLSYQVPLWEDDKT